MSDSVPQSPHSGSVPKDNSNGSFLIGFIPCAAFKFLLLKSKNVSIPFLLENIFPVVKQEVKTYEF